MFSPSPSPASSPGPTGGSDPLRGRHAVVTGASGGIGAAICAELARHGAVLTLLGTDPDRLERAQASLPGAGHASARVDVRDHAAVAACLRQAADQRGPIDILVNNAGIARSAPLTRTDPQLWQDMLAVNLTGTYNCTQAVLEGMLRARWGRIVNVASTAGLTGYAYVSAYCAAKHGVVGFTRALALEVAAKGITVNAVCPGYTDTPLLDEALDNIVARTGRSREQARQELAAANPQGHLVTPRQVANAVAWLCLPGSEAVHGQAIAVAGGEVL